MRLGRSFVEGHRCLRFREIAVSEAIEQTHAQHLAHPVLPGAFTEMNRPIWSSRNNCRSEWK